MKPVLLKSKSSGTMELKGGELNKDEMPFNTSNMARKIIYPYSPKITGLNK